MSEEAEKLEDEGATQRGRKPLLLVMVLVGSIVVGGAVGVFVAVPLLVGSPATEAASGAVPADSTANERPRPRAGRESPPILFTVDNMVLNPKGTGGTRFLMVTTAFEVSDTRVLDQMRQREHEVRDLLLTTYAQKSVEDLTDLSQRESLREDVRAAMESLLHRGAIERVYLPQFVIQ